jgi:hypothetical protein
MAGRPAGGNALQSATWNLNISRVALSSTSPMNMDSARRARYPAHMCNLYSLTKGQAAIRDLFRVSSDRTGNLPLFLGIFPDQMAPIIRRDEDGERELVMARWGMPGPPQFGGQPVTNIRNVSSPHWRTWLGPKNRCIVPATSFSPRINWARARWPSRPASRATRSRPIFRRSSSPARSASSRPCPSIFCATGRGTRRLRPLRDRTRAVAEDHERVAQNSFWPMLPIVSAPIGSHAAPISFGCRRSVHAERGDRLEV